MRLAACRHHPIHFPEEENPPWHGRRGAQAILRYRCLHGHRAPGSFFPTTMTSADFSRTDAREISPGNCTLLHRTAAGFTSTGIPVVFGVLCPLDAPCRPSIRFLSISSRFSPSLPSSGWSPFPSWLQMVVSSFSCSGISTGDLNPVYNVPMLGTHKASLLTPDPPPFPAFMNATTPTPCSTLAPGQA
jgi:hypothetical protein